MKLRISIMLFMLFIPNVLYAQYTSVTGTATDSDGQAWIRGSYKIEFVPNPSFPNGNQYYINGVPLSTYYHGPLNGNLDTAGAFTQGNIPRSDLITPTGTKWKFSFCPMASAPCNDFTIPLNGAGPTDVTASITTAIVAPRFNAIYGTYGYNDSEALTVNATPGSSYYNVISSCQKNFNPVSSTWTCPAVNTSGLLPALNPVFTGTMSGPTINASTSITSPSITGIVNRVLNVMSPPYNAVGDCVADDTIPIRNAFGDARGIGRIVYFPAGCFLTDTVPWSGQYFTGAGRALTTIKGKPGKDVFAIPDGPGSVVFAPYIAGVTITVDNSIDASATAAGGNNTYPNRIAGTNGGLSAFPSPSTPGPVVFGPFYNNSTATGSITAGSNTLTLTEGKFGTVPSAWVIGAPMLVKGAGPSGGDLSTTIVSVVNDGTVTLAANASTTVTAGSGQWGNPAIISPPWYIGACGLALPMSDGTNGAPGINGMHLFDVIFSAAGGTSYTNHACGLLIQSPPNDIHLDKVDFQNLWAGYMEVFPATNLSALFAWTPDTSSYHDVNFKGVTIPAVLLNGNHRVIDGWNIYSGARAFALGTFWYNPAGATGTITRYYDECWSSNSGEHSRIEAAVTGIDGHLMQCETNNNSYQRWDASGARSGINMGNIRIYGSGNDFEVSDYKGSTWSWNNFGTQTVQEFGNYTQDNRVLSHSNFSTLPNNPAFIARYENRARSPLNKLDGGFLLAGTSPFTSGDDLLIPCDQFNFAFQNPGAPGPGCTKDLTGTEITQSYYHQVFSVLNNWYMYPTNAVGQGSGPYGKNLVVGDRIPQNKVRFGAYARCDVACTETYTITDTTSSTDLITSVLNFGTTWTYQTITVDLTSIPLGHVIGIRTTGPYGGATYMDLALMGFSPIPAPSTANAITGFVDMVASNGIDNTGATDVSSAIMTVINNLSNTAPTTLYFAPGTYKIDQGLLISALVNTKSGIRLVGAGRDSTIFKSACTNGYAIWYNNTTNSGDNFSGMQISDLQLQDSSPSNNACNDMIKLTQTSLNVIERIKIRDAHGNTYSTGTIAISGATVTGTGTAWTATMVPGVLQVQGAMAEVCSFVSATQLTLCDTAWPKGTIAAGTNYALAYGGRGLTFDPGLSFTQYISVHDFFGMNDLFCIYSMGSNAGSNGNSRITIDGKAGWCGNSGMRLANAVGVWLGKHSDTFWISIPVNNVTRCAVLDSAHANTFQGFECEDNSSYGVVTTCNGGTALQGCIYGAELNADGSSTGYGNSFVAPYVYLTGTAFVTDNANGGYNLSISGLRSASFSNPQNYTFNGVLGCPANGSGVPININNWDCVYSSAGNGAMVGTTASFGGSALAAGACTYNDASVPGAGGNSVAVASAAGAADPGDGFVVRAFVVSANVVRVKVCAIVAGTPPTAQYNVRVLP